MSLSRFLLRRLLLIGPLLFVVMFVTFMLVRIGGQDPVALLAGPTASTQELELVRRQLGLDRPVWAQFAIYVGNVLGGDLGRSWLSNRPVLGDILERIPVTLELLFWGVGLGALIGIPVGLLAAFRPDRAFDQASRVLSLVGFSIPTYWLGLLMLFVFFYLLGWAPPGMGRISLMATPPSRITGSYLIDGLLTGDMEATYSAAAQLVLPVLCVAIISAAPIIKQTRAIALEVTASDYVRYARAAGLPHGEVRRLVLRNSRTPVMTFVGTEITGLVGTTSLIEYVFAWGGLGQYGLNAIIAGDFTVVQAYVLFLALFSVFVFIVVDVAVLLLDPRAALKS
jgi:ABC-type dipeptide/oligopeptide/nickel transport system permease component